jgi:hypothetical protein
VDRGGARGRRSRPPDKMMLATLFCALLGAAQPAPQTAKPASLSGDSPAASPGQAQAPPSAPEPSPDGIAVAGVDAGAVRVPSAPGAWGGVRTGSEPTLSDRVADYAIDAVLDPVKHTIEGKERLTWRNRSAVPVRSLYFHLYLNAFEGPESTFSVEAARYGGFRGGIRPKKGEWGYIELASVRQSGKPLSWKYVHPDGGPATDHTVVRIDLLEPIPPGGTGVVEIDFHDKLPRIIARTGYFGSFHLVAQWFPKIGVLELPGERGATEPRWNCHELHLNSEFYADFGSYDVSLTLPKEFLVGSVGEEQGAPVEVPGGLRHRFAQGDVHDFAFAAWDKFHTLTGAWDGPESPRVAIKVLYPKEYEKAARSTLDTTLESLRYFSDTLGPYPYRTTTAIVPPFNAYEAWGMEYETFFTSYGAKSEPALAVVPFVTIHEFGHGYFMGILASNEFEEPFLDEGLNEWWDTRLAAKAPVELRIPPLSRLGFPTFRLDEYDFERLSGTPRRPADPIAGNSWHRYSEGSYGLVYARTVLAFHDLASFLGDDVAARAMREYYRKWRFRHPSTADLRAVFEEVSGQKDLVDRWFDEQVYAARAIDDRIESVESAEILPKPGIVLRDGKRVELDEEAVEKEIREKREAFRKEHPKARADEPGPFPFRSVVVARRYEAHLPQTLVVLFDDGSTERMAWDAADRWQRWVFERPARVTSAQLDPDRSLLLDVNKLDDGRSRETHPLASARWTLEASAWTQIFLALLESL